MWYSDPLHMLATVYQVQKDGTSTQKEVHWQYYISLRNSTTTALQKKWSKSLIKIVSHYIQDRCSDTITVTPVNTIQNPLV